MVAAVVLVSEAAFEVGKSIIEGRNTGSSRTKIDRPELVVRWCRELFGDRLLVFAKYIDHERI